MTILHTIQQSPFANVSLHSCLRVIQPGDALLFLQDGVYAALQNTELEVLMTSVLNEHNVYVLHDDIILRGIAEHILPDVQVIGYSIYVDLVVQHQVIQNWS